MAMKDSGIAWIGEIPERWDIKKLKYLLKPNCVNMRVGPFGSALSGDDFKDEGYWVYNQRCVLDKNFETNDTFVDEYKYKELSAFTVDSGDILITTRGTIGKVAVAPENCPDGILHPCIIKFVLKQELVNNDLVELVFNNSNMIMDQIMRKSNATTIDVIYSYTLKDLLLPVIPMNEQKEIIDFLAKKCDVIDNILADLNKQVEVLTDYKKSLITETVTKGLNPNAPMKDSGIDWIGKIPEHWDIKRLKYLGTARNGLTYSPEDMADDGILVMRSSNIQNGTLSFEDNVYVNMFIPDVLKLKENDLLICSRNGSKNLIGKNALITKAYEGQSFGAFMCVYRSKYNKFIHYVFNSNLFSRYLETFLTSTINQLTNTNLNSIKIPFTYDTKEQVKIVEYLDKKCAEIDDLIADKTAQIEKMEKYKKSLIFEYVTGKKRVKGAESIA